MSNDINLVSARSDEIERERRILKFLRLIAGGLLFLITLFSILIFLINISIPINAVRRQQQETLSAISGLSKKLASFHYIKDRLANINTTLQNRKDYPKAINTIFANTPSSLVVEEIKVENNSLVLTFSDVSLLSLNDAIEALVGFSSKKELISDLIIESLDFDPLSGRYNLTFKANML